MFNYGNDYSTQSYEGLIRVVTTYRKELDEDDCPIVIKTCWTDEMEDAGFHEPVGYDEGQVSIRMYHARAFKPSVIGLSGIP